MIFVFRTAGRRPAVRKNMNHERPYTALSNA